MLSGLSSTGGLSSGPISDLYFWSLVWSSEIACARGPARAAREDRESSSPAPWRRRSCPCARSAWPWRWHWPSGGPAGWECSPGSEARRRHRPRDVADVVRAATVLVRRSSRPASSDPDLSLSGCASAPPGECLILLGPLRQRRPVDVRVHRLGERPVEVARPRGAEQRRVTLVSVIIAAPSAMRLPIPKFLRMFSNVRLAEIVPDRRDRRHDVGLIAAIGDHVVRALLGPQVLAAEVPADVHQLHRIEGAAPAPGRPRRARLAMERVFDRHQPAGAGTSPQAVAKLSPTCVKSTASTSLNTPARTRYAFRPAAPRRRRARASACRTCFRSHDLLHRQRGHDVHRLTGVVALAVARAAFDDRLVLGDARLLRCLRNAVDVRAERDDRLAGAPGATQAVGMPAMPRST